MRNVWKLFRLVVGSYAQLKQRVVQPAAPLTDSRARGELRNRAARLAHAVFPPAETC